MTQLRIQRVGQGGFRPLVALSQIACLVMALGATGVTVTEVSRAVARGDDKAVAIPPVSAVARSPWHEEVHRFALRLEEAFNLDTPVADDFSGWILEASKRHEVSPELLAAVIFTESSFRTNVVSHAGAIGPAQVQPFWQPFCGAQSLEDPAENIYCGAQILAYLRDVCGNERCALAAYNVGLRNHRESEEHQEAGLRYVRKVERYMAGFDTSQIL